MQELLGKIAKLKAAVVGDIILDHYVWGDATRISAEAPVPIVRVERESYAAGGAANVPEEILGDDDKINKDAPR